MNDKHKDKQIEDNSDTEDTKATRFGRSSEHSERTCCVASENRDEMITQRDEGENGSGAKETLSFSIRGMSCISCAGKVEEALLSCSGVIEARVDFGHRKARVTLDSERVSPNELKAAVDAIGYRLLEWQKEALEESGGWSGRLSDLRPYLIGPAAALGVIGFYLGLLTLMTDWDSALIEFREYRFWILALAAGLGVQAALFSLFRAWHKGGGNMKAAKCSLAASGGMSTTAMAACCAHYLTVLLPALGLPFLSGAAASLARYQTHFFMVGVLSSLFGIGLMLRMMKRSGMIQVGDLVSHLGLRPVRR